MSRCTSEASCYRPLLRALQHTCAPIGKCDAVQWRVANKLHICLGAQCLKQYSACTVQLRIAKCYYRLRSHSVS
jgi:hypothetical protein